MSYLEKLVACVVFEKYQLVSSLMQNSPFCHFSLNVFYSTLVVSISSEAPFNAILSALV
jgi:hypothetical protein